MEKVIEVFGATEAARSIRGVSDFLSSTTPMKKIVARVRDTIVKKTTGGLDYSGRKFEPYSDSYVKQLRKKGVGVSKNHVTLRRSGAMLEQIKDEVISPNHGKVSVDGDMKTIAYFHNQGGPKPGRPPKREFLNITDNALGVIVKEEMDDPIMKIMGRR